MVRSRSLRTESGFWSSSTQASASTTLIWVTAWMLRSPTVTASDSGLRRGAPPARGGGGAGLEAGALAGRAGVGRHVALDLAAHVVGLGLAIAALQVGDDALECGVVIVGSVELVGVA